MSELGFLTNGILSFFAALLESNDQFAVKL